MACHVEGEDLKSRTRSSRHELSAFRAKLRSKFCKHAQRALYSKIRIRSSFKNRPQDS